MISKSTILNGTNSADNLKKTFFFQQKNNKFGSIVQTIVAM